jgi:two-component system OmpR family response regulator
MVMDVPRILVIEDDDGSRDGLGSLLTEDGYVVRTAASGFAALLCASEFRPHAVVCDFCLPDLDGLQILRRLRATGRDIFIIMVTAGRYGPGEEIALRREADVFLEKPIDLDRLRGALLRVTSTPDEAARALS